MHVLGLTLETGDISYPLCRDPYLVLLFKLLLHVLNFLRQVLALGLSY